MKLNQIIFIGRVVANHTAAAQINLRFGEAPVTLDFHDRAVHGGNPSTVDEAVRFYLANLAVAISDKHLPESLSISSLRSSDSSVFVVQVQWNPDVLGANCETDWYCDGNLALYRSNTFTFALP